MNENYSKEESEMTHSKKKNISSNLQSDIEKPQTLTANETVKALNTSFEGLTGTEAENRLRLYGKNTIEEEETSKLKIFFRQFKTFPLP
ncbi:MAG: cation-transporting P-type ATPase, partial [Candidatus Bathyarchaeota archaeon]|nr:cation-transporting P-type ATPase [Candidatus Bathyarchaeota archaeon]